MASSERKILMICYEFESDSRCWFHNGLLLHRLTAVPTSPPSRWDYDFLDENGINYSCCLFRSAEAFRVTKCWSHDNKLIVMWMEPASGKRKDEARWYNASDTNEINILKLLNKFPFLLRHVCTMLLSRCIYAIIMHDCYKVRKELLCASPPKIHFVSVIHTHDTFDKYLSRNRIIRQQHRYRNMNYGLNVRRNTIIWWNSWSLHLLGWYLVSTCWQFLCTFDDRLFSVQGG